MTTLENIRKKCTRKRKRKIGSIRYNREVNKFKFNTNELEILNNKLNLLLLQENKLLNKKLLIQKEIERLSKLIEEYNDRK